MACYHVSTVYLKITNPFRDEEGKQQTSDNDTGKNSKTDTPEKTPARKSVKTDDGAS